MFDHVKFGVSDYAASKAFFLKALEPLGVAVVQDGPLGVELLKTNGAIDLVHIPYRGLPEAHTSVMRNDALVFMTFFSAGGDLIQSGKLRPVAVTTARRLSLLPDVPTVAESGFPGFEVTVWYAACAPAATPRPVLAKLHATLVKTLALPEMKARLAEASIDVTPSSPEEMAAFVRTAPNSRKIPASAGMTNC